MALRSTSDYIRDEQIALLRRDLDVLINELLSRDEGARLTSLRSFGPLGSLGAGGGLGERELSEWVNRFVSLSYELPSLDNKPRILR
jgi:hypothetical protein